MKNTTLTLKVYRHLLRLYPTAFRTEYSELMLQNFRDLCREAENKYAGLGALVVWTRVLPDLFLSSLQQHLHHWNSMKTVSFASLAVLVAGLLAGAATFFIHSSVAPFAFLAYLCIGLFCVYVGMAFFRETPWWTELLAAVVVFLALGVFLPWWAKAGQELGVRLPSMLIMTPLPACLVMVVAKGVARLWPRPARG